MLCTVSKTTGRLQITSGISLLEFSRLVKWDRDSARFTQKTKQRLNSLGEIASLLYSGVLSLLD